jgi:hypothetical protein
VLTWAPDQWVVAHEQVLTAFAAAGFRTSTAHSQAGTPTMRCISGVRSPDERSISDQSPPEGDHRNVTMTICGGQLLTPRFQFLLSAKPVLMVEAVDCAPST